MTRSKIQKRLFSLVICLCSFFHCYAQQNYVDGFIVSLRGDTVNGFINYKNWRRNPTSIEFKKDLNAGTTSYTPKDIASFGVRIPRGTEIYSAVKVKIDTSSDFLEQLDKNREFNDREDDLFLLEMFKGTYKLYSYENQKFHYFVDDGNNITELKSKSYYFTENKIAKNEYYKTQITELFKNCPKITITDINSLAYRRPDLINIFKKYDECLGKKSETVKAEKVKASFGVVLATDISNLKITNNVGRDVEITSAGNFAVGVSVALTFPRNNKSSSINTEWLYRSYKFSNTKDSIESPNLMYRTHNNLAGHYARFNIMYRYQWTLAKLKPFFNIGIAQGLKFSSIDKSTTEKIFYGTVTKYDDLIFQEERDYEQGINLGFGINIYKVKIELRAETTNGFTDYSNTRTAINSLFLNLNYLF